MDTAINGKVVSKGVKLGEGVTEEMPSKMQGKLVVGKWNYTFRQPAHQQGGYQGGGQVCGGKPLAGKMSHPLDSPY